MANYEDISDKTIWELYCENFLDSLWDWCDDTEDEETNKEDELDGYYVDPKLLRGL